MVVVFLEKVKEKVEALVELLEFGGKKERKEKGKRKRNEKGKIFSWSPKMKISETQIPGIESWIRKSFGKIPESSEIQVSRNDPK